MPTSQCLKDLDHSTLICFEPAIFVIYEPMVGTYLSRRVADQKQVYGQIFSHQIATNCHGNGSMNLQNDYIF